MEHCECGGKPPTAQLKVSQVLFYASGKIAPQDAAVFLASFYRQPLGPRSLAGQNFRQSVSSGVSDNFSLETKRDISVRMDNQVSLPGKTPKLKSARGIKIIVSHSF